MSRAVLHVTEASGFGVLQSMSTLVASQLANGWSVHVVLAVRSDQPEVAALGNLFVGATVETVSGRRWFGRLRRMGESASSAAHRLSPDVIHLHSTWAGVVGRLTMGGDRRRTVVYSPHGWAFARTNVPFPLRTASRLLELLLPIGTAGVVATSPAEGAATPRLPGVRVAVVENAVPPAHAAKSSWLSRCPTPLISTDRVGNQKVLSTA